MNSLTKFWDSKGTIDRNSHALLWLFLSFTSTEKIMRKTFLFGLLFCSVCLFAQREKTICGESTYVISAGESQEEAKHKAAADARIDALARVFGTLITQGTSAYIHNKSEGSKVKSTIEFQRLSSGDVRGEWLGDTREPEYAFFIDEKTGMTSIRVKVCGRAREVENSKIALDVHILRNGVEANRESSDFRVGDDFYCSFASPLEGYLAIFLMDAEQNVLCMLPYRAQNSGSYKILKDKKYLFFYIDPEDKERNLVDEYVMTCGSEFEANYLYFVFSTKPFSKPAAPDGGITYSDFNKWLSQLRSNDTDAQVIQKMITIRQ